MKAYILIVLILLQSFSVMFFSDKRILSLTGKTIINFEYPYLVGVVLNFFAISAIVCVFYIIIFLKTEKESIMKLNSSQEVIDALRGQKHDFNNHLNMIAGMLQLGKTEKALEYIFRTSGKVESVFSVSKVQSIEIQALLCRKCTIASNKGIQIELDINTSLENLLMDPIELCKVLFNLLDNAIYELEHCEEKEKILTIDIQEHQDLYVITVANSFPVLSPMLYNKIFEKKYSTKEGDEHGYGLHIVKQIVEKNQGKITVESYEGVGTIFTMFLPMQK